MRQQPELQRLWDTKKSSHIFWTVNPAPVYGPLAGNVLVLQAGNGGQVSENQKLTYIHRR